MFSSQETVLPALLWIGIEKKKWTYLLFILAEPGNIWGQFLPLLLYCLTSSSLLYKRNWHPNSGKMDLLNISPPSSHSAGFLNEAVISCPDNLSLHLMAHSVASSTSMDSVMIKFTHLILFKNLWGSWNNKGSMFLVKIIISQF